MHKNENAIHKVYLIELSQVAKKISVSS